MMSKHKAYISGGSMLAVAACLLAPVSAHAQTPQGQAPQAQTPPAQGPQGQRPPAAGNQPGQNLTVTGTRSNVVVTPDRMSFNVANDLQVQTGTLADALRAVPGVEVDVQGNVSLRGDPGVTIMIDGRPSAMLRGDNRGDVINSMPASQIERVEVITNPGAELSPEGSAGVINLVTRQGQPRRNTRTATARVNVGGVDRYAVNLNGSISQPGLTATGDVGYRRFATDNEGFQERERLNPATGTFISSRQDSETEFDNDFVNARFGLDYDVAPQNRLSLETRFGRGTADLERVDTFVSDIPTQNFERLSEMNMSQRMLGGRLSWRRTMEGQGHEFTADLDAQDLRMRRAINAVTDFTTGNDVFEEIHNAIDRNDYMLRLDYKRPMGQDQSLNIGYQSDARSVTFDYSGAFGPTANTLVLSPNLTNAFSYDESIHAWYGTYRFKLGELDIQSGLRLEQVETELNQITDGTRFNRDYFRAYPTLHLSYALDQETTLRGSYSRRIQRPNPIELNPYTFYIDPLNIRRGNPNLLPEITDSFELGVQHRKAGNFYSLTGFYRRSSDGITDVISDLGNGTFLTTRENLATAQRVGAEFILNGRFSPELSYNASATVQWHQIDPRIGGISDPDSIVTGSARANLSWQMTPNDFFQLNGNWSGRQLLPQGYRDSGAVLNFGYRRKVNDRLSLMLTVQDVLATGRQEVVFETPLLRDRLVQRGPGRIAFLGIVYNLTQPTGRQRQQEPAFDFQQPSTGDTPG
jgi:outer membrane receptor protein involved in Fe transport